MELINITKINNEYKGIKICDENRYVKLKNIIVKYGQLKNIIVKYNQNTLLYDIIDGYYVYKCMLELKHQDILCLVLNDDNINVDLLTIGLSMNFDEDVVLLSKKITKLLDEDKIQSIDIEKITLFHNHEIERYKTLLTYNFLKYNEKVHLEYNSTENEEFF